MEKSKILCISGSNRNGCTEYILKQISKKLSSDLVLLREKNIALCRCCQYCMNNFECIIKDDSQKIIEKMHESALVIFGVCNHFNNVGGLFANFIDRLLPMYKNKRIAKNEKLKRKKVVFIYVGGGGEEGTEQDVYDALHDATKGMVKYLDLNLVAEYSFMCNILPDIEAQQTKIDGIINFINAKF